MYDSQLPTFRNLCEPQAMNEKHFQRHLFTNFVLQNLFIYDDFNNYTSLSFKFQVLEKVWSESRNCTTSKSETDWSSRMKNRIYWKRRTSCGGWSRSTSGRRSGRIKLTVTIVRRSAFKCTTDRASSALFVQSWMMIYVVQVAVL